ncbi:hypothetical protein [Tabrizicola sp.]|nr:hypothetical protein [Tabrizicola sp.]
MQGFRETGGEALPPAHFTHPKYPRKPLRLFRLFPVCYTCSNIGAAPR